MKDGIFTTLLVFFIFFAGFFTGTFDLHKKVLDIFSGEEAPVIEAMKDVKTQERAEEHHKDAGDDITIFEKPFKTWVKPIKRTETKATVGFVNETKNFDLIRSADVSKSKATFYTFNFSDSTVSEFTFDNPGRSFSLITTSDGLQIKRNNWYWRTLMASVEYETKVDSIEHFAFKNMKAGLETRLEFQDSFEFNLNLKHDFKNKLALKNIILGAEVKGVLIK